MRGSDLRRPLGLGHAGLPVRRRCGLSGAGFGPTKLRSISRRTKGRPIRGRLIKLATKARATAIRRGRRRHAERALRRLWLTQPPVYAPPVYQPPIYQQPVAYPQPCCVQALSGAGNCCFRVSSTAASESPTWEAAAGGGGGGNDFQVTGFGNISGFSAAMANAQAQRLQQLLGGGGGEQQHLRQRLQREFKQKLQHEL